MHAYQVTRGNSLPANSKVGFVLWKSMLTTVRDELLRSGVGMFVEDCQNRRFFEVCDFGRRGGSIYVLSNRAMFYPTIRILSPAQTCGDKCTEYVLYGVLNMGRYNTRARRPYSVVFLPSDH